jgi:hypothetical protein
MRFYDQTEYSGFTRCVTKDQCEAEDNTELIKVGIKRQCRCENPEHIITWNGCQRDPDINTTLHFYGNKIEIGECSLEFGKEIRHKAG